MSAAAEAVIELLARTHRERGRFFAVKRATGTEIGAAFFERDMALDQIDNVDSIKQILLEGIRYHADASLGLSNPGLLRTCVLYRLFLAKYKVPGYN